MSGVPNGPITGVGANRCGVPNGPITGVGANR
jgi:hypothetical protein